jgi:hypothetical protein
MAPYSLTILKKTEKFHQKLTMVGQGKFKDIISEIELKVFTKYYRKIVRGIESYLLDSF